MNTVEDICDDFLSKHYQYGYTIAGAGTGKTTLIAELTRKSLELESGRRILICAHTNSATNEARKRIEGLKIDSSLVAFSTIHSLALKTIQRAISSKLAMKAFNDGVLPFALGDEINIIGADTQGAIFRDIACGVGAKATGKQLKTIKQEYSRRANRGEKIPSDLKIQNVNAGAIILAYQRYKKNEEVLDFCDLLKYSIHLLRKYPSLCTAMVAETPKIFVDEAQDLSALQHRIIRLLGGTGATVFMVGDFRQAMFGFAGADPKVFEKFANSFPECREYTLNKSHRLTPELCRLANEVFSVTFKKRLRPGKPKGPIPILEKCFVRQDQADFIVAKIESLRRDGIELGDIAVLYRNVKGNAELICLKKALKSKGINITQVPLTKSARASIGTLTKLILCAHKPRDYYSVKAALPLVAGVGPSKAEAIAKHWSEHGNLNSLTGVGNSAASVKFLTQVSAIKNQGKNFSDVVTNLVALYRANEKRSEISSEFWTFVRWAKEFKTFQDFHFALNEFDFYLTRKKRNTIMLSTIHSSKGTEWSYVFLMGADHQTFSHRARGHSAERCAMYVAVTRAKQNLLITYCDSSILEKGGGHLSIFLKKPLSKQLFQKSTPASGDGIGTRQFVERSNA